MEVQELITLYPPFLQEFAEIQEISRLITPELRRMNSEIQRVKNDHFNNRMSLQAIEHWERILLISPRPIDTIADRRFRILTRRLDRLPYSEKWLRSQMDSLLSADGYTFELSPENQTLVVKIHIENQSRFETVRELLERVVPLDIAIDVEQLYNKHMEIEDAGYRHCSLEAYTHRQIQEDPSILVNVPECDSDSS
ncbi:MAG: YmfQ family protein [Methanosarcinales archaeon]|jgi:hypothetical protein|nr:YmfQ family protein [Methanosarcinales archaeon]